MNQSPVVKFGVLDVCVRVSDKSIGQRTRHRLFGVPDMTVVPFKLQSTDIERAARLLIRQSGDTCAIARATHRADECRNSGSLRPAALWDAVAIQLRDMIPAEMYPENRPSWHLAASQIVEAADASLKH